MTVHTFERLLCAGSTSARAARLLSRRAHTTRAYRPFHRVHTPVPKRLLFGLRRTTAESSLIHRACVRCTQQSSERYIGATATRWSTCPGVDRYTFGGAGANIPADLGHAESAIYCSGCHRALAVAQRILGIQPLNIKTGDRPTRANKLTDCSYFALKIIFHSSSLLKAKK